MSALNTILATATSFVSTLGLRPIWSTKNTQGQPATLGKQAEEILNDNFTIIESEINKKATEVTTSGTLIRTPSGRVQEDGTLYYTGKILVDIAAKSVTIESGYLSNGRNILINSPAHNITWTTTQMQFMYFSVSTNKFYVQDFSISRINPNDLFFGIVDQNGLTTNLRGRDIDLGKNQPLYIDGFLSSNTAVVYLDFNSNRGFKLRNDAGMLLSNQGTDYKPILAGELNFPDSTDTQYIFFNTVTQRLESFAYHTKPSKSFKNLWYIGYVNSQASIYHLHAAQLVVNGERIVSFTKTYADQLGKSVQSFFPQTNWINKAWNSSLSVGYIYIDKRCAISDMNPLQQIRVDLAVAGIVKLHLLDLTFNVLRTVEKTLAVGLNTTMIDSITYSQSIYVAVENVTGIIRTVSPADNIGNGKRKNITTGEITSSDYSFAYELETIDSRKTLNSRVRVLEDRWMPTSDDINALLAQNDYVMLQPRNYLLKSPVNVTTGKTLAGVFGSTNLILSDGNKTGVNVLNSEGVHLTGFGVKGTQPNYSYDIDGILPGSGIIATEEEADNYTYMGDEIGIYLGSSEQLILENIRIDNMTGSALKANHVGKDYTRGMKVSKLFIKHCYNGIFTENEHEFSDYTDFMISACQIGLSVRSGNLNFKGGEITRSRVGAMFAEGYNHAHGVMTGTLIKHNSLRAILAKNIEYGQSFQGVYVSYGTVSLRDSTGIYFNNLKIGHGSILCSNTAGITGRNVIETLVKRNSNVTVDNTGNLQIINTINLYDNL